MGADRTVKLVINRELRWYELLGIMALSVAAIYALRHAEGNGTPPEGLGHLAAYTLTNVLSITWLAFMVVTLIHRHRTRGMFQVLQRIPGEANYQRIDGGGPGDGLLIPTTLVEHWRRYPIVHDDASITPDCITLRLERQWGCYQYDGNRLHYRGPCTAHSHGVEIDDVPGLRKPERS